MNSQASDIRRQESGKALDTGTWRHGTGSCSSLVSCRSSGTSRGFTLLEVLLAMAILSVIMTVVYVSFSTAGKNIEQAEAIRDETDIARTLISRISVDIANAYLNSQMSVSTIFYGTKEEVEIATDTGSERTRHDGISLTTLTNWRRPDSPEMDLWEVGYFFREKPDGKGYTLYRREKRELSKDVPALEGGDEFEITDRVEGLQITYSDNWSTWTDNGWDSRSAGRLPKAVEIALSLDNGSVYTTRVDIGNRQ